MSTKRILEMAWAVPAQAISNLEQGLVDADARTRTRAFGHRHISILAGMPGLGPLLSAGFLGAAGEDTTAFDGADRSAGVARSARHPDTQGGSPVTISVLDATNTCFYASFTPWLCPA